MSGNFVRERQRIVYIYNIHTMYTIYVNNTLPPALAVHEIYRDIFGPPMITLSKMAFSWPCTNKFHCWKTDLDCECCLA